jgi:hypothetical protein
MHERRDVGAEADYAEQHPTQMTYDQLVAVKAGYMNTAQIYINLADQVGEVIRENYGEIEEGQNQLESERTI